MCRASLTAVSMSTRCPDKRQGNRKSLCVLDPHTSLQHKHVKSCMHRGSGSSPRCQQRCRRSQSRACPWGSGSGGTGQSRSPGWWSGPGSARRPPSRRCAPWALPGPPVRSRHFKKAALPPQLCHMYTSQVPSGSPPSRSPHYRSRSCCRGGSPLRWCWACRCGVEGLGFRAHAPAAPSRPRTRRTQT